MVKEIKRDYYLEQLIKREGNGLIKIVTGNKKMWEIIFIANSV